MFNRSGADQLRPADHVVSNDLQRDLADFGFLGAENHIREILAAVVDRFAIRIRTAGIIGILVIGGIAGLQFHQRRFVLGGGIFQVHRNWQHVQLVDFVKLFGFRQGGTGHAGQLGVHAEVRAVALGLKEP